MANSADDPKRLFQHGDALDLHLGLDPKADPARTSPAPGDIRLLLAEIREKPVAMLFRYKVAGKRLGGEPATFTSPTGQTEVEEAVQVKGISVKIVRQRQGDKSHWFLEPAVPWRSLGAALLGQTVKLHGDIGVLLSDPNGVQTVGRIYWANKRHVLMGDLPAEARVNPSLWGEWSFVVPDLGEIMQKDDLPEEGEDGLEIRLPR
jgi:hypothetical protein